MTRTTKSSNSHAGDAANGRLTGAAAIECAKEYLWQMTGRPCESVSGLVRTDEGWTVSLEVVELERIPRTTDILGSYAVDLDGNGDLLGCERVRRYYRNQADDVQE
jgi:hypothetical protein